MMSSTIKFFVLLVVCVFASVASVQSWQIKSRIAGGSSAVEKQFPYQVSLRFKRNHKHVCGASIIKASWILTAAHCFFQLPQNASFFYGVVNKTHATDQGIHIELSKLFIHPDFGVRVAQPDIALMRTQEPITFSEFVQSIGLPSQEFIRPGTRAIVSGWGISKAPKSTKEMLFRPTFPKTLQYQEAPTITLEECLADFEPLKISDYVEWKQSVEDLNDGVICTRNVNGTGTGMGDSGGPLVFNGELLGLVSWGVQCGNGYPSIYTRIYPQIKWINKIIAEN